MVIESLSSYRDSQMTSWQVIRWWEIRRLLYNGILFVTGIVSIFGMEWCFDKFLPSGEDGIEPMALFFGVVAYGIVANLSYTFGGIVELIARRMDAVKSMVRAEKLFLAGLWSSCLLTTTPFWFGLVSWLVRGKA